MKFSLENSSGNTIVAYDVGKIRIHQPALRLADNNDSGFRVISDSAIITPEALIEQWQPTAASNLLVTHMQQVLELQPEIVLLGTGRSLQFPAAEVMQICYQSGAGFEVMDTGAACRTYNILASEGRRVVAALFMIEE